MLRLVDSKLIAFNPSHTRPQLRSGKLEWGSWDNWVQMTNSFTRDRYRCVSVRRREDQQKVTIVVSKTHNTQGFGTYELSLVQPKQGKDPARLTLRSEVDGFARDFWFALSAIDPDNVTWKRSEGETGDHLTIVIPKTIPKPVENIVKKGVKELNTGYLGHDYLDLSRKQDKAMREIECLVALSNSAILGELVGDYEQDLDLHEHREYIGDDFDDFEIVSAPEGNEEEE